MLVFYLNQDRETDSVMIFLHIPKTGGNTFNVIINKPYTERDCVVRLGDLDDLTMEELKRLEMVRGHMYFGVHQKLPQKKLNYITLVRNPIERVISFFYYMGSLNNPDIETRDQFNKTSLYEFVTEESNNQFNLQTNILAGSDLRPDTSETLEAAKNNLTKYFSLVGITERYDETLQVLQRKLGWEIDVQNKCNVTANKPALREISNEIIEIIKSKSVMDSVLYQFANQLLDEQLGKLK